jgi:hypothetical protein
MSALRGKAENICSQGAFPVLTHLRHGRFGFFAAQIDLLPAVANQDAVSKVGSTLYALDG